VNKNQVEKNKGQINILFKYPRLPGRHFSGRYFPGHDQKEYKK
jgi:hypothetical protein